LGEFSPNGRFFALGSYLKMTKIAHILGASLFHGEGYALILMKKCIRPHFLRFFHKLIWSPWQFLKRQIASLNRPRCGPKPYFVNFKTQ
jgi:hypothetical protein